MRYAIKTIAICSILLTVPCFTVAEIYKYQDDSGRLIFVDDKDKIPYKYQEQIDTISEASNSLGAFDTVRDVKPSQDDPDFFERRAAEKALKQQQTPVVIKGNRVLVPVEVAIGNRSVNLSLLLDTGATTTVFHRNSLSSLNLPSGKSYKARVAGGGLVKSKKIKFKHITVGPFKIEKAYAMVIPLKVEKLPFDGMLGMDFLKHHPYQIDFDNNVIVWTDNN